MDTTKFWGYNQKSEIGQSIARKIMWIQNVCRFSWLYTTYGAFKKINVPL